MLPNVNAVNPMHIAIAAKKSNNPCFFFCMSMLPMRTGTSLQHLKITVEYSVEQNDLQRYLMAI